MRTIILRIETEELCDQIEAALAAAGLCVQYVLNVHERHDVYHVRPIPEHLRAAIAAVKRAS